MSEVSTATLEPRRIDTLINHAQRAAAILLTGLAFSAVGSALENSFDPALAEAQTPSALTSGAGKPEQIKEYVKVIVAGQTEAQKNTFVFLEKCEDDSRKTSHTVTYKSPDQLLGSCDAGSTVTVTEQTPLRGSWIHESGITEKIVKATRKNNHHFVFREQAEAPASTPSPSPEPGPGVAPAQPAQPAPTPGGGGGEPTDPYASGNVGVDISWAQCGTADETPSGKAFGIVDVNDGLGYSTNPCLAAEAAAFPDKQLNLYVNTAWNSSSTHIDPNSPRSCDSGDENCLAYNYGYDAGLYAYNAAQSLDITSGRWWLDVESNATWASDTTQNQDSLQGEHDALLASGTTTVGAYSTTAQWGDITGAWQNDWPSWGATTWTTAADALTYCTGHEFTGGPSEMMQFTPAGETDQDVAC